MTRLSPPRPFPHSPIIPVRVDDAPTCTRCHPSKALYNVGIATSGDW